MNSNLNEIVSGEKTSFINLFEKKNLNITIPIIQRDYAQGRTSEKPIRDNFLNALHNYLDNNIGGRDLDFIYGSLLPFDDSINEFLPLDGQQRLTTLFLLHYYLSNKDGYQEHFQKIMTHHNKSRFRYKTRISSSEFCDCLIQYKLNLNETKDNLDTRLSDSIKNQKWYHLIWNQDPTIQSMMIMLDAIHLKFYSSENFYNRLTREHNPVITFQFLNLDEFDLSDELYIKMNARGKSLSPYENFKAKYEQFLADLDTSEVNRDFILSLNKIEKKVSLQEYFSFKLDTVWSNLFWDFHQLNDSDNKELDDVGNYVLNTIKLLAVNRSAKKSNLRKHTKTILNLENNNSLYDELTKTGVLNVGFALEIIELLELLINPIFKEANEKVNNQYISLNALFIELMVGVQDAAYTKRIQFYASYNYLLKWKKTDGINDWMRVVHNLTINTSPYNDEDEFIRSILAIEKLIPKSNQILEFLSSHEEKITGFNSNQVIEEITKSKLIIKSEEWREIVFSTENRFPYLTNQISCLLSFSGLFHALNIDEQFDKKYENELKDQLRFYTLALDAILGSNGIRKFDRFILERALLTKGNYTLTKRKNHSFLIGNDRDISWKKLLSGDSENVRVKRSYLKLLFDDSTFVKENAATSLNEIITNYDNKKRHWKDYFIQSHRLLAKIKKTRLVRVLSPNNVRLLYSTSVSGYQAELRSLNLYYQVLKDLDGKIGNFTKSKYYSDQGQYGFPCAYLSGWKTDKNNFVIDIYFDSSQELMGIHFFDRESENIPKVYSDYLVLNDFKLWNNDDSYMNYISEEEVREYIIKLTCELKNLI